MGGFFEVKKIKNKSNKAGQQKVNRYKNFEEFFFEKQKFSILRPYFSEKMEK